MAERIITEHLVGGLEEHDLRLDATWDSDDLDRYRISIHGALTGLGNKLAGMVGEFATTAGEFEVFTGIFAFCVLFVLLLLVFFKKLKALTHGAEDIKEVTDAELAES